MYTFTTCNFYYFRLHKESVNVYFYINYVFNEEINYFKSTDFYGSGFKSANQKI